MAAFPPLVIAGQVIESSHHNGLLDNVARKKTALEGQLFFTPGSVIFADSSGFLDEDNSNLFWDNTAKELGIGTIVPSAKLDIEGATTRLVEITQTGVTNAQILALDFTGGNVGGSSTNSALFRITTNSGFRLLVSFNDITVINAQGKVGIDELAPDTILHLGGTDAVLTIDEASNTPANPDSSTQGRIYIKDDKLIFQFNDAGTVRYKFLDLTGTTVTWVHTTTAP